MVESSRTDLTWVADPDSPSLRRAVRHAIRDLFPDLHIVAECFLAAESPIDLLGVGEFGELVSIRIAPLGESPRALTALFSDLAWLAARAEGLRLLSPRLDLVADAPPSGFLVSPEITSETQLAIRAFSSHRIRPFRYAAYRQRGQLRIQLSTEMGSPERQSAPSSVRSPVSPSRGHAEEALPHESPQPSRVVSRRGADPAERSSNPRDPATDLAPTTGFRTGLTDLDLQLHVEEDKNHSGEFADVPTPTRS